MLLLREARQYMVVWMKMAPIGSEGVAFFERIRTCGLVGVHVALLEEMYHWGWALEFQMLKVRPSITVSSCCLPIQM